MSGWTEPKTVAQARELYHGTLKDGDAVGWCDRCGVRIRADEPVTVRLWPGALYAPTVQMMCAECVAAWGPA